MTSKIKNMGKLLKMFNKNVIGITLAPFGIYLNREYFEKNNKKLKMTINHEQIHWKQQMELLIIFFYILYILEYFIKIFIFNKNAYRTISFEREAYDNDNNEKYLETRKKYAWISRILK